MNLPALYAKAFSRSNPVQAGHTPAIPCRKLRAPLRTTNTSSAASSPRYAKRLRSRNANRRSYWLIELATLENTLFALAPMSRIVPTTITRITASITAYSAMS